MVQLWPLLVIAIGGFWLRQPAPADWSYGLVAWQAPALGVLLAGVFGLLHATSNYLQARVVSFVFRITRNLAGANRFYFSLMRPGVLVHELAHAMAAALVGGRILGFNALETSVTPDGQVRLGQVTYALPGSTGRLGFRLKDAFVGLAPLPFGLLLVGGALALSGVDWLGDPAANLGAALGNWRFWVALLAIVEIADHMTPSRVDRKNWPAALLFLGVLAVLAWLAARVLPLALPDGWWDTVLQGSVVLVLALGVPIGVNLLLGSLFWLLTRLVS